MSKTPKYRYFWSPFGFKPIEIGNEAPDAKEIIHIPTTGEPYKIVCVPTPGPDGLHFAPDWHGLTEHD